MKYFLKSLLMEIIAENLFGRKFSITMLKHGNPTVLMGIASANTKPGERPYRITWFDDELRNHHIDVEVEELVSVLSSGEFPPALIQRIKEKWPNGHLVGDQYTFNPQQVPTADVIVK